MQIVKHNKTDTLYLARQVITNATNSAKNEDMMLYMNLEGTQFVRELAEFWDKFSPLDSNDVRHVEGII